MDTEKANRKNRFSFPLAFVPEGNSGLPNNHFFNSGNRQYQP